MARTAEGLSQAALAARCGLRRETISRLERGENVPTLSTAAAICHALGVRDARVLFSELDPLPTGLAGGGALAPAADSPAAVGGPGATEGKR